MYCVVSIQTGPKFLSAGAMVISGFNFIALSIDFWSILRLEIGNCLTKEELMALLKWWNLGSITCGGGGGCQFDFTCRLLEARASLVSPAKKVLRLRSCLNRKSVLSCSAGDVMTFGVGMNFKPRLSRVLAIGGRMPPVVRSSNAIFVTGGK